MAGGKALHSWGLTSLHAKAPELSFSLQIEQQKQLEIMPSLAVAST